MPRYKDSPEVRAAKQERREKLRELLALMEVEDVRDLKSVFKDIDNSRNGHSVKIVKTSAGEVEFCRGVTVYFRYKTRL